MSENVTGDAGNQQGSSTFAKALADKLAKRRSNPSETTRRAPIPERVIRAYLLGALHDGSLNKRNRKRITQKEREWLEFIQYLLWELGHRSWIYKEGATRNVYALETLADFLDFMFDPVSLKDWGEQSAYIRGFFDAEGGVPRKFNNPFYIQFVQRNKAKLDTMKRFLECKGIHVGKVHTPSKRVNPGYWRMYILADSRRRFVEEVGSWHPRKSRIILERVKI